MNPGEPTTGQQWQPTTQQPSGQWGAQPGAVPQAGPPQGVPPQGLPPQGVPQPGTMGWGAPQPPARQFDARTQLPSLLLIAATVAGVVTYFMGFVSWVGINNVSDRELERWGDGYAAGNNGIPGFLSYEIVLNPGKFLIILGAVAVATGLALVPRFRRGVPFLAVIAAGAWLALFAAALTVTTAPVLNMGAGAIVALIFGFLQVALLIGAAVLDGLARRP
ncbi:DUF5336 domain-containing protein [Gordonia sp. NB41Y]|uniref:DUF5336 domain-containing protein n=1 Tax=Gordonia sp. NB41Y TaxID=875808 RepID=UPI0006B20FE4|nr:DUF5336 domain-containing protein [Gordonia sp. NB41Y]KOY49748.1 hypothetical protein ISGA_08215 [Gordonia sp. NB41Y]WLP91908.1 DUF5336 domain-containing protein [Gordonia sp. NB41Y]